MCGLIRLCAVLESSMMADTALLVPSPSSWNRGRLARRACAVARTGRRLRAVLRGALDTHRCAQPQTLVIGEHAAVLDHGDPGRFEDARDLVMLDPELEPHDLGP